MRLPQLAVSGRCLEESQALCLPLLGQAATAVPGPSPPSLLLAVFSARHIGTAGPSGPMHTAPLLRPPLQRLAWLTPSSRGYRDVIGILRAEACQRPSPPRRCHQIR
jgi:hypothetical protein